MCLLIFAHRVHCGYPLVVAANRDEFHARPTEPSSFWPEHPALLAGRDLEQGGTWMGMTRGGRFAAITNYRDPSRTLPAPRSRGELPLNYLIGSQSPESYLQELAGQAEDYAGYNLLVGDSASLWYFTNSLPASERAAVRLEPGIYGLSNARLDTPWPKVSLGKCRLEGLLEEGLLNHAALAAVVADRQLADLKTLHRQGMGSDMEQLLSAQFIITGSYGTRSTTSLWIDDNGLACWRESSFNAHGEVRELREESFEADGWCN